MVGRKCSGFVKTDLRVEWGGRCGVAGVGWRTKSVLVVGLVPLALATRIDLRDGR